MPRANLTQKRLAVGAQFSIGRRRTFGRGGGGAETNVVGIHRCPAGATRIWRAHKTANRRPRRASHRLPPPLDRTEPAISTVAGMTIAALR